MTPPSQTIPIIPKIRILHKDLYVISRKLGKRDKLGIHAVIENLCVEILSFSIEAAFQTKFFKKPTLEKLRIKISVLQNLIRTEYELQIVEQKIYIRLSEQLVEISKMANGWLNFITQKGA